MSLETDFFWHFAVDVMGNAGCMHKLASPVSFIRPTICLGFISSPQLKIPSAGIMET